MADDLRRRASRGTRARPGRSSSSRRRARRRRPTRCPRAPPPRSRRGRRRSRTRAGTAGRSATSASAACAAASHLGAPLGDHRPRRPRVPDARPCTARAGGPRTRRAAATRRPARRRSPPRRRGPPRSRCRRTRRSPAAPRASGGQRKPRGASATGMRRAVQQPAARAAERDVAAAAGRGRADHDQRRVALLGDLEQAGRRRARVVDHERGRDVGRQPRARLARAPRRPSPAGRPGTRRRPAPGSGGHGAGTTAHDDRSSSAERASIAGQVQDRLAAPVGREADDAWLMACPPRASAVQRGVVPAVEEVPEQRHRRTRSGTRRSSPRAGPG